MYSEDMYSVLTCHNVVVGNSVPREVDSSA
jgi:hypothetical protein